MSARASGQGPWPASNWGLACGRCIGGNNGRLASHSAPPGRNLPSAGASAGAVGSMSGTFPTAPNHCLSPPFALCLGASHSQMEGSSLASPMRSFCSKDRPSARRKRFASGTTAISNLLHSLRTSDGCCWMTILDSASWKFIPPFPRCGISRLLEIASVLVKLPSHLMGNGLLWRPRTLLRYAMRRPGSCSGRLPPHRQGGGQVITSSGLQTIDGSVRYGSSG
jgi:hypothetical protein